MTAPSTRVQITPQEPFCAETRPDPCGMVVFGASGDLAERKLFPALYRLRAEHLLPPGFHAIGVGRTPMSDAAFRAKVADALKVHARGASGDAHLGEFVARLYYETGDYADADLYRRLATRLGALNRTHEAGGNRLHYLSIPPGLYARVVDRLGAAGLARSDGDARGWTRIVVEKPFGRDLATARELNERIAKVFDESQIYRIDHYLGKETVQNILVFRFANLLFESLWNRTAIDHVQITAAEDLGIGHRAGYYEEAGVLRDMFQNHLLQLLCFVAMEPPSSFAAESVRDEKLKVLRSIRPFAPARVDEVLVRGQYGPGRIGDAPAAGYTQETGVAARSLTPTFAALTLFVDNWRWKDVPFYLRSGKRMAKRLTEVAVQFKPVPHLLFEPIQDKDLRPNVLVLRIQPEEGISLSFETKSPGPKLCMSVVDMDFDYERSFGEPPGAYERLFLDCMAGDATLFIRADWALQSWALLAPLLESESRVSDLHLYPAGSWGPPAADRMLAARGHVWRAP